MCTWSKIILHIQAFNCLHWFNKQILLYVIYWCSFGSILDLDLNSPKKVLLIDEIANSMIIKRIDFQGIFEEI